MTGRGYARRLVGFKRRRMFLFNPRAAMLFELRAGLVHVLLRSGEAYTLNQSVRELAALLEGRGFLRVHRHVLVNLDQVVELAPAGAGRLELRVVGDRGDLDQVVLASRPASVRLRRLLGLSHGRPRPTRDAAPPPAAEISAEERP